jgi:transposase
MVKCSEATFYRHRLLLSQRDRTGFMVLPMRWVVERTHAWTERWRRTVMHHDRKLAVSAAWVWLAETRMLLSRLAYRS